MRKLLTVIAMLWAGMAAAQEAEVGNGTAFGDWIVACDAISTQEVTCRLVQTQRLTSNGALVLQMVVFPSPGGGALIVAQMPMGVYLPGGAVFRAADDEEAPVTQMVWQRCFGDLCEAALQLDEAALADVIAAEAILFAYQLNPGDERTIAQVKTAELAEGLAAIRPDE